MIRLFKNNFKLPIVLFLFILLLVCCYSKSVQEESNISYEGVEKLIIESKFFHVNIKGVQSTMVNAGFFFPRSFYKKGLRVLHEKRGTGLYVTVQFKPWFFMNAFRGNCRLDFQVPQNIEMEIQSGSGNIIVNDNKSAFMKIRASSGKIQAGNITAQMDVETSSGRIVLNECHGNKEIKASSGRVFISNSTGDIICRTSSGPQILQEIKGNLTARSSSGKIDITGLEGKLDLQASSGRLTGSNITLTDHSSFSTSSGSIIFDFNNVPDDFTFHLKSSSGTISAGKIKAKGTIVSGSGKITITGTSSSGKQVYQ